MIKFFKMAVKIDEYENAKRCIDKKAKVSKMETLAFLIVTIETCNNEAKQSNTNRYALQGNLRNNKKMIMDI